MGSRNSKNDLLLVLGASTRAAAFSSLAAGGRPICFDRYADADLAAHCAVTRVGDYPRGMAEMVEMVPDCAWMYTGGLENHRPLIARIASKRPLYGNASAVLACVRDPFLVDEALRNAGLETLKLADFPAQLPSDGTWMVKDRFSSGGQRVAIWTGSETERNWRNRFYQQRAWGCACSALYVAARRKARLLGATEQLLVALRLDMPPFGYAGSVGPLPLEEWRGETLRHIGKTLAEAFDLTGLFGVDYIDDGEMIWPVEINPRFTASAEVLERGYGFSAVEIHIRACRDGALPIEREQVAQSQPWQGKRVVFAEQDVVVSEDFTNDALREAGASLRPRIADIPRVGVRIRAGEPILTVFASGASRDVVLEQMESERRRWLAAVRASCLG